MRALWVFLLMSTAVWGESTTAPAPEVVKKPFPAMYIITEVTPLNFRWHDLSLEEKSFTFPLMQSWEKFISTNLPVNVGEVKVCGEECLQHFRKWQEEEPQLLTPGGPDAYKDSLWVKIGFYVQRGGAGEGNNHFQWEGRVNVLDINSKHVLMSFETAKAGATLPQITQSQINSALATRIYKTLLPSLKQVMQKLPDHLPFNRASRLVIKGASNMAEITGLLTKITSRGNLLGLVLEWDQFGTSEARFLCFYRGEEKSFSDLLSQLKELKSSKSYELVHEYDGTQHVINLIHK